MACTSCGSVHQSEFTSEMAIAFTARKRVDMPAVFLFPTIVVCLHYGLASFTFSESELRLLSSRRPFGESAA